MKKPFITLTGVDESTDMEAVAHLDAEIGFLYSAFRTDQSDMRYPSWNFIERYARQVPRAALHICGRDALGQLQRQEFDVSSFGRIQLNGFVRCLEVEEICAIYPQHVIITQWRGHHTAHTLDVKALNHVLLVDRSGGRGISPDEWEAPPPPKHAGFAGGLGPDNLAKELARIRQVAREGWWVDMEGKLRNTVDLFDVERARKCCDIFHAATS